MGVAGAPFKEVKNQLSEGKKTAKTSGGEGKRGVGAGGGWEGLGARGGSMRARCVARAGRWAAHDQRDVAVDTKSLNSQRRRNQAAPLPCRHGESNPEPCRPSGRQGGPANGFFRSENPEKSAAQAVKCGDKGVERRIARATRIRAGWGKGGSLGTWALAGSHLRPPRRRSKSLDMLAAPANIPAAR